MKHVFGLTQCFADSSCEEMRLRYLHHLGISPRQLPEIWAVYWDTTLLHHSLQGAGVEAVVARQVEADLLEEAEAHLLMPSRLLGQVGREPHNVERVAEDLQDSHGNVRCSSNSNMTIAWLYHG